MSTKPEPKKTRGMCIATRCTSVEQFIQMFHRFVDEESFFVSTLNTRPPGLETSFSVQLVDGTPVLRGLCVVMQAWTDASNPFKTPGVRLGIKRLTANSMVVFEQLLITRTAKTPAPTGGTPLPVKPIATKPLAGATPGTPVGPKTLPGATPVTLTPATTKPFGAPKLKPPATIAVGVPKSVPPKVPTIETAPTKLAPSRVELKQPVRPSSEPAERTIPAPPPQVEEPATGAAEPVPEPIAAEPTDVIEEKTDVREPKQPVATLAMPPSAPPAPPAALDSPTLDPKDLAAALELEKPAAVDDARTPGSDLVLPANPLMNLSDQSLEGYVDCTLYEETGNFFPADDDAAADFVDDVVPPPVAARADAPPPVPHERQRTITPLPAAPEVPAAAAAAAASADADVVPARDSTPSILVPPAIPAPTMPRDSVMVDPALIARGSTPAFEAEPKPPVDTPTFTKDGVQKPAFDEAALPLRAKPTGELAPLARKRPPWWMLGGAVGVVGLIVVVIVFMTSKSDGSSTPPATTNQPAKPLAQVASPGKSAQVEQAVDDASEEIEEDHGDGPPVVGTGPCQIVVATTPAGSMVRLDGNTVGPSPLTIGAPCGEHKLDISHARYQATSKMVTLTEGKPHELEVTLQRPTHTVTVTSNPPGATVFIDGRSAGTTPTKLNVLGFVTIKLELKKTGYQPAKAKLYSRRSPDQVAVRLNRW